MRVSAILLVLMVSAGVAQTQPAPAAAAPGELGAPPAPSAVPRLEFAFESRVTLSPAVVVGDTLLGHRQYIPITGGTIKGPKFSGEVVSGGWDYQLGLGQGCTHLSADYFIRATDGTLIHVLNEGISCGGKGGERRWLDARGARRLIEERASRWISVAG